ncbi:hypothetical protein [Pustulibacterium marinum]|nr:hypothetical protein [Pustulibacterium marinum]
MQYWNQNNSKANKLIVIKDGVIYKGNPKYEVYNRLTSNAQLDFLEGLFSIPYNYITAIENQHGKNELKIYYRKDSEEELILEDEQVKNEIFEHLRQELPEFSYSKEHPSLWKYAKPQFFALLIVTGLYIYMLHL